MSTTAPGVLLQGLRRQGALHDDERGRVGGQGLRAAGRDAVAALQGGTELISFQMSDYDILHIR